MQASTLKITIEDDGAIGPHELPAGSITMGNKCIMIECTVAQFIEWMERDLRPFIREQVSDAVVKAVMNGDIKVQ